MHIRVELQVAARCASLFVALILNRLVHKAKRLLLVTNTDERQRSSSVGDSCRA